MRGVERFCGSTQQCDQLQCDQLSRVCGGARPRPPLFPRLLHHHKPTPCRSEERERGRCSRTLLHARRTRYSIVRCVCFVGWQGTNEKLQWDMNHQRLLAALKSPQRRGDPNERHCQRGCDAWRTVVGMESHQNEGEREANVQMENGREGSTSIDSIDPHTLSSRWVRRDKEQMYLV